MKKAVNRLFQLRQALDECEKEFGLKRFLGSRTSSVLLYYL